jgi:hypothetical protein
MPIIIAPWEAEIGRTAVQGQLRKIVHEISSSKEPEKNGLEVCLKL